MAYFITASQFCPHTSIPHFRVKDLADLIPQVNPDGSGHILKPEFRNVLNRMNFYMDDDEFDKLWSKYDFLFFFFFLGINAVFHY